MKERRINDNLNEKEFSYVHTGYVSYLRSIVIWNLLPWLPDIISFLRQIYFYICLIKNNNKIKLYTGTLYIHYTNYTRVISLTKK